jgi:hypothetical protein
VLEVVTDDVEDGWFVVVGGPGVAEPPADPSAVCNEPCLGICCRFN